MQAEQAQSGSRWAARVRYALMAAIGVMVVLSLAQCWLPGTSRLAIRSAYGQAMGAAPSFLALMLPSGGGGGGFGDVGGAAGGGGVGNLKFYLIDTTKQVICVYDLRGDKIRLVSAREYSRDMDIADASLDVPMRGGGRVNSFEGTQGLTRTEAAAYADGLKQWLDESEKKSR